MHQQHVADADARPAKVGHRAGAALAQLGNAVAAAEIEIQVAIGAQNADRQRLRLAVVEIEPVKGDLLDLFVGRIDVRGPHDQFLGAEVAGRR